MPSDLTPAQIRAALEALGQSVTDLAPRIGIDRTALSHVLSGRRRLPRPAEMALRGLLREAVMRVGGEPPEAWGRLVKAAKRALGCRNSHGTPTDVQGKFSDFR